MESWQRLSEEVIYNGYRKLARRMYQLPDRRSVDFEIMVEPQVATILALTAEHQVILARQFRPGPGLVLLELPGGAVEPGEDPLVAARRELLEETGYEGELRYITETINSAYSTMRRFNFVALNCRRVSEPRLDTNEFIEVVEMPLEDFRSHLRSGRLTDVATGYLGLDLLGYL